MSGTTMIKNINTMFPYKESSEYKLVVKTAPDVVVIMLGTNDASEEIWNESQYIDGYYELIKSFK